MNITLNGVVTNLNINIQTFGWSVNIDSISVDPQATTPQIYDVMVTLTKANYAGTVTTKTWSTPNPWRVAKFSEIMNQVSAQIGVLLDQEDMDILANLGTGALVI